MNVIRFTDADFEQQRRRLTAPSSLFDPDIEQRTRQVVEAVKARGDAALCELTHRFDGAQLTASQIRIRAEELQAAAAHTSQELREAITNAERNLRNFSTKSLRRGWSAKNLQGGKVGEKYDPFGRVGIYIPGGTAPLVSTVLMTVTLAKVAGCREIVVCTPCNARGEVNPGILYAADFAGATEIYRAGGAQAIAAMAFGTSTIPKVHKIFGPGNAYVVAAKRLLFGQVAVDLLPGPSEVLIIADETARPEFIAADLLAQAEHGSGHERTWLITTCGRLLEEIQAALERQLSSLTRQDFIRKALNDNGWLLHVESMEEAVRMANDLAPEHCEIMAKKATAIARQITTAGALCLGHFTPNVLGDYVAGPSHVLPTGGAGASFAGLTVDQFQRRTSLIQYDRAALAKSVATIQEFAQVEGLDAHGRSATIRLEE
jgi:histidinol dehydrogenase